MNYALITDEQRIVLLANGRESLENPDFDPAPVVKLFTPDAGATWLLTEIDPDDHDHAFLGGDVVGGDADLVAEAAGLGHGGDLVDDDGPHFPAALSPARRWNTPVRPTMREKPSASAAVHSPVASP